MPLKIDHVTLAGSDLKALEQVFALAGLATDYGGPHSNGITHMSLLGFDDGSYIELISTLEPGQAAPWWDRAHRGQRWAVRLGCGSGRCGSRSRAHRRAWHPRARAERHDAPAARRRVGGMGPGLRGRQAARRDIAVSHPRSHAARVARPAFRERDGNRLDRRGDGGARRA